MADPTSEPNPVPHLGLIPDPNASERDQILGVGAKPDATRAEIPAKWHKLYDQLVKERDLLIDETTELTQEAREVPADSVQREQADVGTDEYDRDQNLGVASYDQDLLAEINDAIGRMQAGTYGVCELTGKPIPKERLEAVPWARFTKEAQEELEAKGQSGLRAGIGEIEKVRGAGSEGEAEGMEG